MNIESFHTILNIGYIFLLMAFIIALFRLIMGPDIHNRLAAMDFIASIIAGFILLYSMQVNNPVYIDIVMVISLISFIGTVAVSVYLKQKS